ncbi:uncharacterized protein PFL1_01348 [Pseudozyma flocculosa PF-1]|uniref:uncharacterized protein n=1 Tax=Pseudozyma flocculosa PF-1 TaxID=1277687 RepID=UPI00045617E5|nr:uncharacterized protein PFL1_01348 [Pseudozyma flocculosa PF-1]EPQ31160.1 hypothetical protein PFL1_01348 [Pseudozyma flocculosa PF-1]
MAGPMTTAASYNSGHAKALLESLLVSGTTPSSATHSTASSSSHTTSNNNNSNNNGGGGSARSTSLTTSSAAPSSSSVSILPNPLSSSAASSSNTSASVNGQLHLTPTFRPHKPSSLSSSASASASEEDSGGRAARRALDGNAGAAYGVDGDDDQDDDDDEGDDDSEMATSPPFSASFKAAQLSMQALHNHHRAPPAAAAAAAAIAPSAPMSHGPTPQAQVAEILALLNDTRLDEEERIDRVRSALTTSLFSREGVVSTPSRLDSLVLELLHRHREDVNPTGASFAPPLSAASPARRPASIRSFSSSRPWTPSKPSFVSTHSNPGPPGFEGGMSSSTSSSGAGFPHQATSPLMTSVGIPPPTALSASGSPKPHPGVIGSGSPRASPRPWNRTLSNLSTTSVSSSLGGETSVGSPISSVPPGLSAASTSRPASPSPFGSPRLNVAATEFRPKGTPTASFGSGAALTPTRPAPWLTRRPSSNASSTNLALANKSHAGAGDDDDDEFSPFGSTKPVPWSSSQAQYGVADTGDSNWYSSGASTTSSNGGWEPGPGTVPASTTGSGGGGGFARSGVPGHPEGDDEAAGFGAAGMTPFDLLYSILVTGTKHGMAEWSPEQVDEALMANGYDFERTLAAISENGGKPLGDGSQSILSGPLRARRAGQAVGPAAGSPRVEHATGAPGAAAAGPAAVTPNIRAGVNVLTREAFSSMHRNGSGFGASAARFGAAARGLSASPAAASASSPRSPGLAPAGLAGALHGAKVCRYFIAGECRRSDCKFSHDLGRAVCRYWLKGQCAHNPCNFLHDYDALNALAVGITGVQVDPSAAEGGAAAPDQAPQSKPANDDFPELGLGAAAGGAKAAASRGRWSAALQRSNNPNPLTLAQKEGQGVIHLHGRGNLARPAADAGGSGRRLTEGQQLGRRPAGICARGAACTAAAAQIVAALSYATHRGDSLALAEQRNKLLARASDAFRRGDFAAAKKWSREAAEMNERFQDQSRGAARDILRERMNALRTRLTDPVEAGPSVTANQSDEPGARGMRGKVVGNGLGVCLGVVKPAALQASMPSAMASHLSVDERTECFLDLHGLHSQEAVELVEEFLLGLESEGLQGLAYLAIGRERHSSKETDKRRVKVAGFVKQFLSGYSYPFAEWDGVLVVDHCTHV